MPLHGSFSRGDVWSPGSRLAGQAELRNEHLKVSRHPTTIFSLLIKDHRALSSLLERIEKTTERGRKSRRVLIAKAHDDFEKHARAEERVLYESLRDLKPVHELILEADEEHGLARRLFDDLKRVDVADERWLAKFKVLKESIEHHVEEEEDEMFPKARKVLPLGEQRALGERFTEVKAEEEHALTGRVR